MRNIDPVIFASTFAYSELPIMFNGKLRAPYVSEHKHEFDEIVLVVEGTGVHQTRLGDFPVKAGMVLIIPEGEFHGYADCKDMLIYNCMIRTRRIPLPLGELYYHPTFAELFLQERTAFDAKGCFPMITLNQEDFQQAVAIMERCNMEVKQRKIGWSLNCLGGFFQYLTLILRNYSPSDNGNTGMQDNLNLCLDFISTHNTEKITIDELCRKGGFSKSTLYRQFKRSTGMSSLKYQLTRRLAQAANMLIVNRELQIGEIAHIVGFSDSNYFSKQFRAKFKCTPREYRMKGQEAHNC